MRIVTFFAIAVVLFGSRAYGGGACDSEFCPGDDTPTGMGAPVAPNPVNVGQRDITNTTDTGAGPQTPGKGASTQTQVQTSANAGANAASSAANQARGMTGAKNDSQNDVQKNVKSLTDYGSNNSRSSGTLDIAEGTLILLLPPPVNTWLAGKYFDSGRKAHQAADNMSTLAAAADQNNGKMGAMNGNDGTASAPGQTGASASAGGSAGGASGSGASSGAFGSDRANDLFNKLEAAGVDRNDFVDAVNKAHGDPAAVGAFLEDKTDGKIAKDDVMSAWDNYVASGGKNPNGDNLNAFAKSEPGAIPSHPMPVAAADATKKVEKLDIASKNALRDKLRASLAKTDRNPAAAFDNETLQPLREDKLFQGAGDVDSELSLFDVVHARYSRLTDRMRPGLRGMAEPAKR